MLPTLSPTVAPASGSGLGTAETGGLVGGVLVFFAVCFAVYKMCFKTTENTKNDAFKERGESGYELASAQPAVTSVPVSDGELLTIKDVQTSL